MNGFQDPIADGVNSTYGKRIDRLGVNDPSLRAAAGGRIHCPEDSGRLVAFVTQPHMK